MAYDSVSRTLGQHPGSANILRAQHWAQQPTTALNQKLLIKQLVSKKVWAGGGSKIAKFAKPFKNPLAGAGKAKAAASAKAGNWIKNLDPFWKGAATLTGVGGMAALKAAMTISGRGKKTIRQEGPPPFTGGQGDGIAYQVTYSRPENTANLYAPLSRVSSDMLGPISGLRFQIEGNYIQVAIYARKTNYQWYYFFVYSYYHYGNPNYYLPIVKEKCKIISAVRLDGQPDIDGDPPGDLQEITLDPEYQVISRGLIKNSYKTEHKSHYDPTIKTKNEINNRGKKRKLEQENPDPHPQREFEPIPPTFPGKKVKPPKTPEKPEKPKPPKIKPKWDKGKPTIKYPEKIEAKNNQGRPIKAQPPTKKPTQKARMSDPCATMAKCSLPIQQGQGDIKKNQSGLQRQIDGTTTQIAELRTYLTGQWGWLHLRWTWAEPFIKGIKDKIIDGLNSKMVDRALLLYNTAVNTHILFSLTSSGAALIKQSIISIANIIGIKDADGIAHNLEQLVGKTIEGFIKSIVGAEIYNDTSQQLQAANKIYQAAANIINMTNQLIEDAIEIIYEENENIVEIGESLKNAGLVPSDATFTRREQLIKARNKRFEALRKKLEKANEKLGSLQEVTSNVEDLTNDLQDIKKEYKSFETAIIEFKNGKAKEHKKVEEESQ